MKSELLALNKNAHLVVGPKQLMEPDRVPVDHCPAVQVYDPVSKKVAPMRDI